MLIITLQSCDNKDAIVDNIDLYHVNKMWIYETNKISNVSKELNDNIITKLKGSRKVNVVKGIGIYIELVSSFDTIQILSFGGEKYFYSYENHSYYKINRNLLPDSIIIQIKRM